MERVVSEIIEVKVTRGIDYVFYWVIVAGLAILGFLIWRGIVFSNRVAK